ncbi:MAG: PBP1A family penicillin-binding protein [Leptospirales bacterium]|nr:PBP1A family penicillin-binding protein [Leptospirales bacterium]
MQQKISAEARYRAGLFGPPGRSGLLSRVIFHGFSRYWRRLLGERDDAALLRAAAALAGCFAAAGVLIAATPADFFLVWRYDRYDEPSIVYALNSEGKYEPIAEYYQHARRVIELPAAGPSGLDSKVVRCFLATEDNDFFYHPGVDMQGILRAMAVNLLAGEVKEGASTITQQVARLRFLNADRSLVRKVREAFIATLFELRYDKRRIMEIYLNTVPLGMGAYGVEAASQFYFGKSYDQLSWGEAAVLASMTTRPEEFSPFKNPQASIRKVRIVFAKLVESGYLSAAEAESEFRQLDQNFYATLDRSPNDSAFNQRLNRFPYVTEYVRQMLLPRLGSRLYTGGYRIYTTIQIDHQEAADQTFSPFLRQQTESRRRPPFRNFDAFDREFSELASWNSALFGAAPFRSRISRDERQLMRGFVEEMQSQLEMLSGLSGDANILRALEFYGSEGVEAVEEVQPVEGALISIRPYSGEITAMVGGSGFAPRNQQLRFVRARRQPGSAFKPLIYASAIEYGGTHADARLRLTASTLIDDSPVTFVGQDLSEYSPENYSGDYAGLIRLRQALTLSKNAVAVRVYEQVGPGAINPTAEKLLQMDEATPRRRLPREAAVALGSYAVTPLEMARAYAVFASNGRQVRPYSISYVSGPEGDIILDNRDERQEQGGRQVVSPGVAQIMTSMLQDVVASGTGRGASLPGRAAAGKTGTTNRGTNAWFVGYTPELVTAMYVGFDNPMSLGSAATGGGLAAPVWGRYMSRALRHEAVRAFSFPGSNVVQVNVCEATGMLPGPSCPETLSEIFLPGTQPTSVGEEETAESGAVRRPPALHNDEGSIFREDELR